MPDKAIIFGINNYQSIIDLRGCLNDAQNMSSLLAGVMEFRPENVRVFADDEVTWDNIQTQFDWLVDDATEGDRLVFHFSGHGSHIPSSDDDETDDELICLWDMNWGDPNSYLLDDDLRQLTELAPAEAELTMVLDCCHSGTGTRAFGLDYRPVNEADEHTHAVITSDTTRHLAKSSRTTVNWSAGSNLRNLLRQNQRDVVLARFVAPPLEYQPLRSSRTRTIRRIGRHLRKRQAHDEMNHQLLAGARDDQTAADAFINGDFHGAFTYYLCQTVTSMSSASFNEVMDATIEEIRVEGFGQVPQNEGPFGANRVFGGVSIEPVEPEPALLSPSDAAAAEAGSIGLESAQASSDARDQLNLNLLHRMLTVSEKFLDLADRAMGTEDSQKLSMRVDRSATESIVYVHGISQHLAGYSDAWFAALRPHLQRAIRKSEVLWSQLVNPRSLMAIASEEALHRQEMAQFKQAILDEIQSRAPDIDQLEPGQRQVGDRGLFDGTGLMLDDFARYMFVETTRNRILAEFDRIVRPLLALGNRVHIVSHSWGTVVAYEGLRRMDYANLPGRVRTLFTVGSALSISAVQTNLFQRLVNGRLPRKVDRIINLDAGGDAVGGPIGVPFTVFREYLDLEPTGCARWPWPFNNKARSVSCAHGSYFKSDNIEVNRDIFARFIN